MSTSINRPVWLTNSAYWNESLYPSQITEKHAIKKWVSDTLALLVDGKSNTRTERIEIIMSVFAVIGSIGQFMLERASFYKAVFDKIQELHSDLPMETREFAKHLVAEDWFDIDDFAKAGFDTTEWADSIWPAAGAVEVLKVTFIKA